VEFDASLRPFGQLTTDIGLNVKEADLSLSCNTFFRFSFLNNECTCLWI